MQAIGTINREFHSAVYSVYYKNLSGFPGCPGFFVGIFVNDLFVAGSGFVRVRVRVRVFEILSVSGSGFFSKPGDNTNGDITYGH